jgi:hypothetical protein
MGRSSDAVGCEMRMPSKEEMLLMKMVALQIGTLGQSLGGETEGRRSETIQHSDTYTIETTGTSRYGSHKNKDAVIAYKRTLFYPASG